MSQSKQAIVILTGGVGGAKLVNGFYQLFVNDKSLAEKYSLHVIVNTGDDFEHIGLSISPDIDTLCYVLSDQNDRQRGWGLRDETWQSLQQLKRLGAPDWFQLGDKDLATHIWRTWKKNQGETLEQICQQQFQAFGVENIHVYPMSNDTVSTKLNTKAGEQLDFQSYFVEKQCEPEIENILYCHADSARLSQSLKHLMDNEDIAAVFVAPSNPMLSVAPLLAMSELRGALKALKNRVPVIAVSPLIAGKAVKGPTAKLFDEFGLRCDSVGVAQIYQSFINSMIIDEQDLSFDGNIKTDIESLDLMVKDTNTFMQDDHEQMQLAKFCIDYCKQLHKKILEVQPKKPDVNDEKNPSIVSTFRDLLAC